MEAESLNNSENVEDNQQITDEEVTAKDLNSCSNGIKIKSVKNQNVEAIELVETPTKSRYIFSPQSSERPIQKKSVSADTDNRPVLPILSADISAEIGAKKYLKYCTSYKVTELFSSLVKILNSKFNLQIFQVKKLFNYKLNENN